MKEKNRPEGWRAGIKPNNKNNHTTDDLNLVFEAGADALIEAGYRLPLNELIGDAVTKPSTANRFPVPDTAEERTENEVEKLLDREAVQHLWCQHCKAMQKTNDTVVECWYNAFAVEGDYAFCAANEDAVDHFLSLMPKVLSGNKMRTGQQYTLIQFEGEGIVIIKEGNIEISEELVIDGEPGVSPIWHGTLKDLIRAIEGGVEDERN